MFKQRQFWSLNNSEDKYIRRNYGIESKFITSEICLSAYSVAMWSYRKMIDGCKFTLKQTMQAQRGCTGVDLLFV
jgi:hypothetical protein